MTALNIASSPETLNQQFDSLREKQDQVLDRAAQINSKIELLLTDAEHTRAEVIKAAEEGTPEGISNPELVELQQELNELTQQETELAAQIEEVTKEMESLPEEFSASEDAFENDGAEEEPEEITEFEPLDEEDELEELTEFEPLDEEATNQPAVAAQGATSGMSQEEIIEATSPEDQYISGGFDATTGEILNTNTQELNTPKNTERGDIIPEALEAIEAELSQATENLVSLLNKDSDMVERTKNIDKEKVVEIMKKVYAPQLVSVNNALISLEAQVNNRDIFSKQRMRVVTTLSATKAGSQLDSGQWASFIYNGAVAKIGF
jgi:outer membrane murein-binding lipoprotein Lpp